MNRWKSKPLALFTLVGVLGAFACGDDENPVDPDDPPEAPTAVAVQVTIEEGEALGPPTSIIVSWTDGTNATSHRVDVTGPDEFSEDPAAGTNEVRFDGLSEGETYSVVVTAINDVDETAAAGVDVDILENVVFVVDDFLADVTFTSDNTYLLQGPVFVGSDIDSPGGVAVTLTIEPGTTILGDVNIPEGQRGSYLVVTRGSEIIADANANEADPTVRPDPDNIIVFTSSAPRGERTRGDWGGLVINGRAPTNAGDEAEGEGESGLYGGDDEDDSSGILRGVRVEFAGDDVTATDQLNGIAFQGVGAGTTVDYVQVHYNVDDGTEPFGGMVTQTHMVMTGVGDDSFDGTDGYKGFMQFLIAQQRADAADQGFEISNNGDDGSVAPHSTAVIANATMVGAGVDLGSGEIAGLGAGGDNGVNLREGSNYRLFNNIIVGFGDSGFCVEGGDAAANADTRLGGSADPDETLRFENNVLFSNVDPGDEASNFTQCGEGGYTAAENETFFDTYDNIVEDPLLPAEAFDIGTREDPPVIIATGNPAGFTAFDVSTLNGAAGLVMPTDGRVLVATTYPGAVEPGTALADAWYFGWTVWAEDGSDSRPNHLGQ
jgi:hypothetical protein